MADLCLGMSVLLNCTCQFVVDSYVRVATSGCSIEVNQMLLDELVNATMENSKRVYVQMIDSALTDWSSHLQDLPNTWSLKLSHNTISHLGIIDYPMDRLQYIYLDHNRIDKIPPGFLSIFPTLFSLDLSHNRLEYLDSDIFSANSTVSTLAILTLNNNRIAHIASGFLAALPRLASLDLSHNDLKEMYADDVSFFAALPTIVNLTLSNNHLTSLNNDLVSFQSNEDLRFFNINHNNISYIGSGFFTAFPRLQEIHLSYNSLTRLDSDIFTVNNVTYKLPYLDTMSFSHNDISHIDAGFWSAPTFLMSYHNLLKFDLSHNALTRLDSPGPDEVGITDINLSHNLINNIGMGFLSPFSSLRSLNLAHNRLTELQVNIVSRYNWIIKQDDLRALNVSHNTIVYIDVDFLTAFPFLADLDLSYNSLTRVEYLFQLPAPNIKLVENGDSTSDSYIIDPMFPNKVCSPYQAGNLLRCLEAFNLGHNNIVSMPDNFAAAMPRLKYLDLSFNSLSTIYTNISSLSRLHLQNNELHGIVLAQEDFSKSVLDVLDLRNNMFSAFPEKIQSVSIDYVYLQGNPWYCDCNLLWMKTWILQHTTIAEKDEIRCRGPFYNTNQQLTILEDKRFICDSKIAAITVSIILLIMLVLAFLFVYRWRYEVKFWLYHKYGFHPFDRDECENENKKFDVFISYSNEDDVWARELIEKLQLEGFCVCCHEQDFLSGTTIAENVERAVHFSKRTVCIVSRAFMESNFCMHEFITARSFDFSYKKNRLLVIMYEDIPYEELHKDIKLYVKTFTYLKKDCTFFMKRLLYALPQVKIGDLPFENHPLLIDIHNNNQHY